MRSSSKGEHSLHPTASSRASHPSPSRYVDTVHHAHLTFNNLFAGVAMLAAYSSGLPWLQAAKAYVEANILWLEEFLGHHVEEVGVMRPEATFLVWLDCSRLGLSPQELNGFMLRQ
ncbi:MAG: hypothetical protein SGPRY_011497, partial [Prymnesium sp.]